MGFAAPEEKEDLSRRFNSLLFLTDKSGISYLVVFEGEKLSGREMFDKLQKKPELLEAPNITVYRAAYKDAPFDMYSRDMTLRGRETLKDYAKIHLKNIITSDAITLDTYKRYTSASMPKIGIQNDTEPLFGESTHAALAALKPIKVASRIVSIPRLTVEEKSEQVEFTTKSPKAKTYYGERETIVPKEQAIAERTMDPIDRKIAARFKKEREKAAPKEEFIPVVALRIGSEEYRIEGITPEDFKKAANSNDYKIFAAFLKRYNVRAEDGAELTRADKQDLAENLFLKEGGNYVFLRAYQMRKDES